MSVTDNKSLFLTHIMRLYRPASPPFGGPHRTYSQQARSPLMREERDKEADSLFRALAQRKTLVAHPLPNWNRSGEMYGADRPSEEHQLSLPQEKKSMRKKKIITHCLPLSIIIMF